MRSSDIGMLRRRAAVRRFQGLPVEPVLEDRLDIFKRVGPDGHRPFTCLFKTLGRVAFTQTDDPQAGSEALFRMFFTVHDFCDQSLGARTGLARPLDNP